MKLDSFRQIWAVDFEFHQPPGELPTPICMVARELRHGHLIRLWQDQLLDLPEAPFPIGRDSLMIAYLASAELGCFLELGWPMPSNVLDLCVEFKRVTSGREVPCGRSLLGALTYFGLDAMDATEKDTMRQLAMRGGPYSDSERSVLLDYCQSDVDALAKLLPTMTDKLDLLRALLRGRYMIAVARMERWGVPIDVATLERLKVGWEGIQDRLIDRIDAGRGIYDGRTFRAERWLQYLASHGIAWPFLPTGSPALDDDTFREMAKAYPREVAPIRELRHALSQLRLQDLAVGRDGRNRTMLSPFGSRTGRNQPSNSRFIFGPAVWLRSLIRPEPGQALAYLDVEQEEFGCAAALSGDPAMQEAYRSGDPYLAFAKQAGAVPANATKASHRAERERFKVCALAVQYSMGPEALARKLGEQPFRGRELIRLHHATYPRSWAWSDTVSAYAALHGRLQTCFGWTVHARKTPIRGPSETSPCRVPAVKSCALRAVCLRRTVSGSARRSMTRC